MHLKALLVCHFSFVDDWSACHLNELGLLLQVYLGDSSNLTEKGNTDLLKGALELTSGLIQEIQSWASQYLGSEWLAGCLVVIERGIRKTYDWQFVKFYNFVNVLKGISSLQNILLDILAMNHLC